MDICVFLLIIVIIAIAAVCVIIKRLDDMSLELIVAAVAIVVVLFFGISMLVKGEFAEEEKSYEVVESNLVNSQYSLACKNADGEIEIIATSKVRETDGEERLVYCKYRWWFLTNYRYIYYRNFNEHSQSAVAQSTVL